LGHINVFESLHDGGRKFLTFERDLKLVPWCTMQGTRISNGKIHPQDHGSACKYENLLARGGLERSYFRGRSDLKNKENILFLGFFLECLNNLKGH